MKHLTKSQQPLGVNFRPLLQFVVFTFLSCPPNILWQNYLEEKFPGYAYLAATGEKTLDKANTARKLLFDQTLGAFVNTVAFVAAMAAFKGKGMKGVRRDVERVCQWTYVPQPNPADKDVLTQPFQDVVPLMINSWKLWPFVAIVNFTLVPVKRRVIVSSVIGLFWGIYLSLFAAMD